jgi:hypothetical protein
LDDPIGQKSATGSEGRRPRVVVDPSDAEHDAGRDRIDPQDRGDASDIAEQDRRRIAELPADAVGNDDLVRSLEPQLGRDLIPGDDLGAIALADALDQGAPLGKLLRRGDGRLARGRS